MDYEIERADHNMRYEQAIRNHRTNHVKLINQQSRTTHRKHVVTEE